AGGLRLAALRERLTRGRELLGRATPRLLPAWARRRDDLARRVQDAGRLLDSLSYHRVLDRGFAVVRDEGGKPVTKAAALTPGQAVAIELSDGTRSALVDGANPKARQGRLL
ncbi:MAG: exodeoxyribonuclease VII large subunit, partial [Alphaproteobacteria bacterium]|nr:exodeoxyribonuclease VII large subunit [Alphaproteobacteria bacterium]